jgi:3',5'-cyclic AMP phosphodiesterase CpdA
MKIAVLSDVHAVLPALEAVLAEPDVAAADRIVLTGDLAAGPQPVETRWSRSATGPPGSKATPNGSWSRWPAAVRRSSPTRSRRGRPRSCGPTRSS